MTLIGKRSVSWDTRIFTFQLEHEKQTLGLPIGQHLMIKPLDPVISKDPIIRSYTAISDPRLEGKVELLVKIYFENKTAPGGRLTTTLDKIPIGTKIDCKGPTGRFQYLGNGRALIGGNERKVRSFRMICGGTGITPIFQVLRAIVQDPDDPTSCDVLDGNRTEGDILCRLDLDSFVETGSRKCKVVHTLSKGPEAWTGCRDAGDGSLQDFFGDMPHSKTTVWCSLVGRRR